MIPKIGRLVHYVLPENNRNAGEHRPAIIVRVFDTKPSETSHVQLQVFTDDHNDGLPGVVWRTSVTQDSTATKGNTWHEPERDEEKPAKATKSSAK